MGEMKFTDGKIIKEEMITGNTKIVAKILHREDGAKFVSIQKYYQLSKEMGNWKPNSDRIAIPYEHKNEIAMAIFNYEE
jgi:hypothetical protein